MITLEQATVIVEAALARGGSLGLRPLTVGVLDAGGHLVAFQRQDGSGILRPRIAVAKAWGALGMGSGSRAFVDAAAQRPAFYGALATLAGGNLVPVPGGVLVRDAGDDPLGAIGVSGDTSDADEECAVHAVREAGLRPDPGG